MTPQTKAIRAVLKHIPDVWVRTWRDGQTWAGPRGCWKGAKRMQEIRATLEAAGYRCACNGKPGTAGEHIVEIL